MLVANLGPTFFEGLYCPRSCNAGWRSTFNPPLATTGCMPTFKPPLALLFPTAAATRAFKAASFSAADSGFPTRLEESCLGERMGDALPRSMMVVCCLLGVKLFLSVNQVVPLL